MLEWAAMPAGPAPQFPQHRITLFFGPEPSEGRPDRVHCVFNVKKRSWKGGIQVVVEVDEAQVTRARQAVGLDDWIERTLKALPEEDRREPASRVPDLFVQALCAIKLDLAVEAGLPQANTVIGAESFAAELDRLLPSQAERVTRRLREELDLEGE
jgi:hypothetical protein